MFRLIKDEDDDDRVVIARCEFCGYEIHAESDTRYGDDAYFIDGTWCCDSVDCTCKLLKKFKVGG